MGPPKKISVVVLREVAATHGCRGLDEEAYGESSHMFYNEACGVPSK